MHRIETTATTRTITNTIHTTTTVIVSDDTWTSAWKPALETKYLFQGLSLIFIEGRKIRISN